MLHIIDIIRPGGDQVAREPRTLRKITSRGYVDFIAPSPDPQPDMNISLENIVIAKDLPFAIPRGVLRLPLPFDVPKGGILRVDVPNALMTGFYNQLITLHWEEGNYPQILDIPYFLVAKKHLEGEQYVEQDIEIYCNIPKDRVFIPVLNYGKIAHWLMPLEADSYWKWDDFQCSTEYVQIVDYRGDRIGDVMAPAAQLFNFYNPYRYYVSELWRDRLIIKAHILPTANNEEKAATYYFVILGILANEDTYIQYMNANRLATTPDI